MNVKSGLRRLYADLVRGRTSVRIAQPIESIGEPPIFLIGVYRSGTTLMRLLLDSHSELACPPETSFVPVMGEVVYDGRLHGLQEMGFSQGHVEHKLAQLVDYFYSSYAASAGKKRWVDKSPEHVWHLGLLKRLFPEARFISLTRYALDQVDSHVRSDHALTERLAAFTSPGADLRVTATRYWASAVQAQLDFARAYPDAVYSVRYEDLCLHPEDVLSGVFKFLGVAYEPQVLEFGSRPHDFGRSDDKARTSRTIRLSTGSFASWPEEVKDRCLRIAAPQLAALSWSEAPRPTN